MRTGVLAQGNVVKQFEKKFALNFKTTYAVACNSGTAALHMAYLALDLKPGDEVITTPFTFVATINMIKACGAIPVYIDIKNDFNMDEDLLEAAITKKTKLIVPVHLFGKPCKMDKIMKIAKAYGISVVEDCAQALGSEYKSRQIGTFGDIGCFDSRAGVTTNKGIVSISKIKVGDKVLTHKNKFRKVTKLYKRKYKGDWYKLYLNGMRSTASWKSRYLCATKEHPILINRNGKKEWMSIKDIRKTDMSYIQKSKCKICGKIIPFYWDLCEYHNPAELPENRLKISKAKDKGITANVERSKFKHFYKDILPYAKKLEKDGYRVIPVGVAVPDIIAIKNGKITAYEIENQRTRKRKQTKYGKLSKYYDDIKWIKPEAKRNKNKAKHTYFVDDEGDVCVPIEKIEKINRSERFVYNLEVEKDHSYYVGKVAVHNCFSFYPTKMITTGEGGMCITNNKELAEKMMAIRNHGISGSAYEYICLGYNYKMTNLAAGIGLVQLDKLGHFIFTRRDIAKEYNYFLEEVIDVPIEDKGDFHVYNNYSFCIKNRDMFILNMKENNIDCRVYYPKPFADLPNATRISKEIVSIPIRPNLTSDEAKHIIFNTREILKCNGKASSNGESH